MRHVQVTFLFLALLITAGLLPVYAQSVIAYGTHGKARADEVLVKIKPGMADSRVETMHGRLGARLQRRYSHVGWQRVKIPAGMDLTEAINQYKQQAEVADVEPNYIYHTTATPNDPYMTQLWGLTKIQAPAAWDISTGSSNVVVGVIDSGVNYTHGDLRNNMWVNTGEVAGNGIDDDRNGYVDDVHGINAAANNGNPTDDAGHGTHVAGTIGAVGNNGAGVAGINWTAKIMALKFIGSNGSGNTADAIECYNYAIAMKQRGVNIRVVNDSWGGGGYSQSLLDAINAAGNAGILSVAAAGNDGQNIDSSPDYPAGYTSPHILSVAASGTNDSPASFSNYGVTNVDLAAPGVQILSTVPGGGYSYMSGTSMASPHAAGAAALLAAKNNSLSVADMKNALMSTVDKLSTWTGRVASGGRLNLLRALQSVGGTVTPPPPPPPTTTTRQPDLLIRANAASSFTGGNIYGSGTNETVAQQVAQGATAIYQLSVQNDGNAADSMLLTAPGSGSGWTIRYFNAASGGTEITSQVTGSGWQTASLSVGASLSLRVEITPASTVAGGTVREVAITAKSTADAAKSDTVKANTTVTVAVPRLTGVTLTTTPLSPQRVNTPISLRATATGGTAEYLFRVGVYTSTGLTWYTLRNYSTTSITSWYPTRAGSYLLMVYARAAGSGRSYDVYTNKVFTINP